MFAYCENNPVNRSDPDGADWRTAFAVGISVAGIGLLVLASLPFCGPLLAGVGVSAATAATAANATVATGLTIAGSSLVSAATNDSANSSNNYQKARSNKEANKWARQVGENNAESLKEWYVGKKNVSKFNMLRDKDSGQIILESIKDGIKVATEYFMEVFK